MMSPKRFIVSIYEIRQELVWAEEFTGQYSRSVTLSDGTTRTVELTPVMRDGRPAVEFLDSGQHRTYMGLLPVHTATHTNGTLMVQIVDLDDVDRVRTEPDPKPC
jgi:hypothetical protein